MGRPSIPLEAGRFDIDHIYALAANESAYLVQEGVAEPREIDTAVKLATNWPSGPCEKADQIGIDVIVRKLEEMYHRYQDERYTVAGLLKEYVEKNRLGRRSGAGFYEVKGREYETIIVKKEDGIG